MKYNLTLPSPVWMEIDRRKVRQNDLGDYKVIIEFKDDKYELSHTKSIYTVEFYVDYKMTRVVKEEELEMEDTDTLSDESLNATSNSSEIDEPVA